MQRVRHHRYIGVKRTYVLFLGFGWLTLLVYSRHCASQTLWGRGEGVWGKRIDTHHPSSLLSFSRTPESGTLRHPFSVLWRTPRRQRQQRIKCPRWCKGVGLRSWVPPSSDVIRVGWVSDSCFRSDHRTRLMSDGPSHPLHSGRRSYLGSLRVRPHGNGGSKGTPLHRVFLRTQLVSLFTWYT